MLSEDYLLLFHHFALNTIYKSNNYIPATHFTKMYENKWNPSQYAVSQSLYKHINNQL